MGGSLVATGEGAGGGPPKGFIGSKSICMGGPILPGGGSFPIGASCL